MSKAYTENGVTFVFHKPSSNCFFDSYIVVEPKDSQSGNWEVWNIEAEGSDDVTRIEDVEFVPEDLLLEIFDTSGKKNLTTDGIHWVLAGLLIGARNGEKDARASFQKTVKFAIASLTGEIELDELEEAAEQHYCKSSQEISQK